MLNLRMSDENCPIFNCHGCRTTPGISFLEYQRRMTTKLTRETAILELLLSFENANLKLNIAYFQTVPTNQNFSIFAIGQKLLALLLTILFNTHRVRNKFHYAGLYTRRTNASLLPICDTFPTLNLPTKSQQFLSDINLVLDCGCKGEDNKITTVLYDRCFVYKTVKSSHWKKLQII